MSFDSVQAIILAGGRSTRFKTGKTKLLVTLCGQEMVLYPTLLLERLNIPITLLVGYEKEKIKNTIDESCTTPVNYVIQEEQKGTGHALLCTQSVWQKDHILVLNGDLPLIKDETIAQLLNKHTNTDAAVTFVTAHNADPSVRGYGRVTNDNETIKIVEEKEFTGNQYDNCCLNAGIYVFKRSFLQNYIEALSCSKTTNEFYLTQLIELAQLNDLTVSTVEAPFDEVRGINTLKELWTAEQVKRSELISYWMDQGVRFSAPQTVHIDKDVSIGAGTYIGAGVHILEGSIIGTNCIIECFSVLKNAKLAQSVTIAPHSVIQQSIIESNCVIGPFAHIDQGSSIDAHCQIGNFVQTKRTSIGKNTKAKHLAYLGDAIMGNNANIGAGTITCNYDGYSKHPTIIQDNCFIGSNSTLIAPLIIAKEAFVAAGSTITTDIPSQAFAIGRSRQVTKELYAQKIKAKAQHHSETMLNADNTKKPSNSPNEV